MSVRFIRHAGEAYSGEYVDAPCDECGELHCDCDDQYRDPEALRAYLALSIDEQQARLARAHAQIAAAFEPLVEVERLGPGRIAA